MNKAGRLTTVKVVMSSICTHTFIFLKIPDWVVHEIDKRHQGSFGQGRTKLMAVSAWSPGHQLADRLIWGDLALLTCGLHR